MSFMRLDDLSLARLRRRWRCHGDLQRCQYVDRPMDNTSPTWITRLRMLGTDPSDYGYDTRAS